MKKRAVSFLLTFALVLGLCACGQKASADHWQTQYDLGVRYLSEGNYEEAIIAFTAAIEIDPKRPEGYSGLANAYLAAGDIESAIDILIHGSQMCEDADEFDRLMESLLNGSYGSLLGKGITDNMVRWDEVQFLGHSIVGLDVDVVRDLLWDNGFAVTTDEYYDDMWLLHGSFDHRVRIHVYQAEDSLMLEYCDYGDEHVDLPIGIRDIYTGDSVSEVFTKLGFSNGAEIAALIDDWAASLAVGEESDLGEQLRADHDGFHISAPSWGMADQQLDNLDFRFTFDELEGYSFYFEFESDSNGMFLGRYYVFCPQ